MEIEPIAVVGGDGYLGSAICSLLVREGVSYWVVGRGKRHEYSERYRDSRDIVAAVRGARTVLHLASLTTPATGEKNPELDLANVQFTVNLIAACTTEGVGKIVFASSGGTIYGELANQSATEVFPPNPSCSYGIAKLASEGYLRNSAARGGPCAAILRISNIYGGTQHVKGDQGVIGFLVNEIIAGRSFKVWGDTVRDYVHIDDVSSAFLLASQYDTGRSAIFNVSTAVGTSLSELTEIISTASGRQTAYEIAPMRPFDLKYNVLDNEKIETVLGWMPAVTIKEGLQRIVSAAQNHSQIGNHQDQAMASITANRA
jgi:UDP-glucose 4-epimerase